MTARRLLTPTHARHLKGLHRTGRRAAAVLLVVAGLIAGGQPPALAHSQLINSVPAAGASLDQPPTSVSLVFSEGVEPRFASVTIAVAGAEPAQLPARVQGNEVVAEVPISSSGAGEAIGWEVAYRVVSGDGHPITGTVNFTVTAATTPAPTATAPTSAPASAAAEPTAAPSPAGPDQGSTVRAGAAGLSIGALLGGAALVLALLVGAIALVARMRRERST